MTRVAIFIYLVVGVALGGVLLWVLGRPVDFDKLFSAALWVAIALVVQYHCGKS